MLAMLRRIPPMARGPLALLALAGLLAVKALSGYLAQPRPLLDSLVAPTAAAVGFVAFLAWLWHRAGIASRTRRYNIGPGGAPQNAIDHEVAHADKGFQFGGTTTRGAVYPDGSGFVEVRLPRGATVAQDVAVDMAGSYGEGRSFWSNPHAWGDRANAAARVAHLSPDEQRRTYRQAEGMAHPRLFGSAGHVRRALERTGRYH